MTSPTLPQVTVIDAAHRAAAARKREQRQIHERYEFFAKASEFPDDVIMAGLEAVRDGSEAPLVRLPAPWVERAIAAFRRLKAEEQLRQKVVKLR
jgi:hypothetical protein